MCTQFRESWMALWTDGDGEAHAASAREAKANLTLIEEN
jgi:hypothetical protein